MAIMNSDMSPTSDDAIEIDRDAWPTATLDPVAKMRALAAGLPNVAIDETVFDVSFERFWPFIEDLEGNTPRYEGAVHALRILDRVLDGDGEQIRLEARTPLGLWIPFDCVLRSGWCIMQSKSGQIGMAAHPESPAQTRFIHFERASMFSRLARPFFAWNIRGDFRRLRAVFPPTT
jgi:hypothetical protein